ncbi:unnamed protein product [Cladocopium goreaui]|uniref:LINE-1 retrotransposable element ORF2 protein n=1 Tax=Cladocopium goreaui TaxID=2562237 RepID=A0A9P1CPZ0_9DINO|nr:unnamed protein product [Cladocopium goreaui]
MPKVRSVYPAEWNQPVSLVSCQTVLTAIKQKQPWKGNLACTSTPWEVQELIDLYKSLGLSQGLTLVLTGPTCSWVGSTLSRARLQRQGQQAKVEDVHLLSLGTSAPWKSHAIKIETDKVKTVERTQVRVVVPEQYRSLFISDPKTEKITVILGELAQWGVRAHTLTGGRWQREQWGRSSALIGWLRLTKADCQVLVGKSGTRGIFVNQHLDPAADRPSFFWISKQASESSEEYFQRCTKEAKARGQPIFLRKGLGSDLGFSRKPEDPEDRRPKAVEVSGVPAQWHSDELQEFLTGQDWREVSILNRHRRNRKIIWLIRAVPPVAFPYNQGVWTYEDGSDLRIIINDAVHRPYIPQKVTNLKGPRRQWAPGSQEFDNQETSRRGRSPTKRPPRGSANRERSRSAKASDDTKDSNAPGDASGVTRADKPVAQAQMEVDSSTKDSTQAPTSSKLGIGDLQDALCNHQWSLVDQGGVGDCGWRALCDSYFFFTQGKQLSNEECIHEASLLRVKTVQHVRKFHDRYESFVKGGKAAFPDFCEKALDKHTWICGLLLQAAAEVYGCCIVVWDQTDESLRRFTFAPEWGRTGMPRVVVDSPTLVVQRKGKHYCSVRPPDTGDSSDKRTKVPSHWMRETARPEPDGLGGAAPPGVFNPTPLSPSSRSLRAAAGSSCGSSSRSTVAACPVGPASSRVAARSAPRTPAAVSRRLSPSVRSDPASLHTLLSLRTASASSCSGVSPAPSLHTRVGSVCSGVPSSRAAPSLPAPSLHTAVGSVPSLPAPSLHTAVGSVLSPPAAASLGVSAAVVSGSSAAQAVAPRPETGPRKRLWGKQKVHWFDDEQDLSGVSIHDPADVTYEDPTDFRPTKKDSRPSRQQRWSTIQWVCPICKQEMELSGHDKAYKKRALHLRNAHNTKLSMVGPSISEKISLGHKTGGKHAAAKNGAMASQRAFVRAKALAQDHDHDMRHCTSHGLFDAFKKTWFCTKCLNHQTSRLMASIPCSPATTWTARKARWWQALPDGTRNRIRLVAGWTKEHFDRIEQMCAQIVAEAKPQNFFSNRIAPDSKRKLSERIKKNNATWRKENGLPDDSSGTGGLCNGKVAPMRLAKRTGVKRRRYKQATEWLRDLTKDGDVESNPGPTRRRRVQTSFPHLKVWQCNLNGFGPRGWEFVAQAEKDQVDILLIQEMRLKEVDLKGMTHSLTGWSLFYCTEAQERTVPHGGGAVLTKVTLPAVRAAAHSDVAGQWIRVTLPGLQIYSVYQRPGISSDERDSFHQSISQDFMGLGPSPCLVAGDWNHDPVTSPLRLFLHDACVCFPSFAPDPEDPDAVMPAPTRWDGQACIDWGICRKVTCDVEMLLDRWADHRVLAWTLYDVGISAVKQLRLTPRPNLCKPDVLSEATWQAQLTESFLARQYQLSEAPSWEQLCCFTETVVQEALLAQGVARRQPTNSHKGHPAKTEQVVKHHRTLTTGESTIKLTRLRRFWRRAQAWHTQGFRDNRLRDALLREAAHFRCPFHPLSIACSSDFLQWLADEIEADTQNCVKQRLQAWRRKMQQDAAPWKWLSRYKISNKVSFLADSAGCPLAGQTMFDEIENTWRQYWPQNPRQEELDNMARLHDTAPWPNGPAAPDLPPLRGIQFRAKARDAVKKASGPDGWRGDEIMHLPEGLLQLFANFFNQLESGSQSWPTALLQWRQVCIPKPSGTGLRPLSIGSVWYRMWSSIRIKQMSQWIVDRVGPHFHGGVKQRGTVSALLKPLCLLQKTQNDDSQPGRHRRLAARRRLLRWIGAADLSKAFDRLHGALAGPALKRMGLPAALVDAWTAAWIHQMRFLQFGSQTSKGAVRNISCLPQGDPCSPLALLGVLAEALWRLQKKHPERTHGPTVWRIYIDDRSWFCARMKTCLSIGKGWIEEMKLLHMDENASKADYAVVGPAALGKKMCEELRRQGMPGEVRTRPKLLGTRIETKRTFSKAQEEEVVRLQRATAIANNIASIPGSVHLKTTWLQGAAVSLASVAVVSRLPALRDLTSAHRAISRALASSGHSMMGPLFTLFHGHKVNLRYQVGNYMAEVVLKSHTDPDVRKAWNAARTRSNGPQQRSCAQWGLCRPSAARSFPATCVGRTLLFDDNHEELRHVLRDAWRATLWERWKKSAPYKSRSYHSMLWRDVADRFNLARTMLAHLPAHLLAHAWAVVCGHVVSQAQYHGDPTRDRSDRDRICWFCQKETIPTFLHAMWECDAPQFAERPVLPTCSLQLHLGWPDPTKDNAHNTKVLVHMAEVRRDLTSMRRR